MKTYIIITIIFLIFSFPSFSQVGDKKGDTLINYLDINKKKQGVWEKKYKNGQLRYTGQFIDDLPVGEFRYYYKSGKSKSILKYNNLSRAQAILYWENGNKMAEGVYDSDSKRDSVWALYSESGSLSSLITYLNGKANGKVIMYYPNSDAVTLFCYYKDGKLDGEYKRFFINKFMQEEGQYESGKRVGCWKYYSLDSNILDEGPFENGQKHGKWISYEKNPKGDTINYIHGFPEDYNQRMQVLQDTLEWAKKNQHLFKRPEDYLDNPAEFFK